MTEPAIPTYRCILFNRNQLRFWCPHCRCPHYHGAPDGDPYKGAGHRIAHCYTDAGLRAHPYGYDLVVQEEA
jgi:hypothetical protein